MDLLELCRISFISIIAIAPVRGVRVVARVIFERRGHHSDGIKNGAYPKRDREQMTVHDSIPGKYNCG